LAELMSRDSVRVRPKKVSWRKLMGRASRRTQSSSIEAGLHGGGVGVDVDEVVVTGVGVAAVANARVRRAAGRLRKFDGNLAVNRHPKSMMCDVACS